jgi:hypothetical protein
MMNQYLVKQHMHISSSENCDVAANDTMSFDNQSIHYINNSSSNKENKSSCTFISLYDGENEKDDNSDKRNFRREMRKFNDLIRRSNDVTTTPQRSSPTTYKYGRNNNIHRNNDRNDSGTTPTYCVPDDRIAHQMIQQHFVHANYLYHKKGNNTTGITTPSI